LSIVEWLDWLAGFWVSLARNLVGGLNGLAASIIGALLPASPFFSGEKTPGSWAPDGVFGKRLVLTFRRESTCSTG